MISKQQLGNTLWGMAEILYSKVEDYKTYILSLLFFKRLSDNYTWESEAKLREFRDRTGKEPNEKQRQRILEEGHIFKIPESCFWADVKNVPMHEKNDKLNRVVNAIADANPTLKGIINVVRWNEPAPDGSGGKRLDPELLNSLINYLDAVQLDNSNVSVDVLGDAYEYLIAKFADENKGGKVAAQFYTPEEVREIMVRYVKPRTGERIYDPTCGSGGFLINSAKYAQEQEGGSVRLYGQEAIWNTWAICRINMMLHSLDAKIEREDTIRNPKFIEGGEIDQFDLVLANFPFSQENWWQNGAPKKDKKGKTILKKNGSPQLEYPPKDEFADPWNRLEYGTPPFSNGDFVFIQHIIKSLNETGRAGVVCPQGVLFRGQPEKTEEEDGQNRKADDEYLIRRGLLEGRRDTKGNLIENTNIIEAIVVLPENLFYGTPIPGAVIFFNKNKPEDRKDKVLMVYAAREGWYKELPNLNQLMPHDILRILVQLEAWGDIEVARQVLPVHKERLFSMINEKLFFQLNEIELNYSDEVEELSKVIEKQADDILKINARKLLEKKKEALEKKLAKRDEEMQGARDFAAKERQAINEVELELITMFCDPELRKRYFAIVNSEDLEENEFNLNIPRFVDTFEPEDEIPLNDAIRELNGCLETEKSIEKSLKTIFSKLDT